MARGAELTDHSHLVPRLTTIADTSVFPLCGFMACTETSPSTLTLKIWKSMSPLLSDVMTHHRTVVTQNFQTNTLSWKVRRKNNQWHITTYLRNKDHNYTSTKAENLWNTALQMHKPWQWFNNKSKHVGFWLNYYCITVWFHANKKTSYYGQSCCRKQAPHPLH